MLNLCVTGLPPPPQAAVKACIVLADDYESKADNKGGRADGQGCLFYLLDLRLLLHKVTGLLLYLQLSSFVLCSLAEFCGKYK